MTAYAQLRLARPLAADLRLPWERTARPADPRPGPPGFRNIYATLPCLAGVCDGGQRCLGRQFLGWPVQSAEAGRGDPGHADGERCRLGPRRRARCGRPAAGLPGLPRSRPAAGCEDRSVNGPVGLRPQKARGHGRRRAVLGDRFAEPGEDVQVV